MNRFAVQLCRCVNSAEAAKAKLAMAIMHKRMEILERDTTVGLFPEEGARGDAVSIAGSARRGLGPCRREDSGEKNIVADS